ncbi:MAG: four helix bundle protein [Bacteroidetes bacterium]|nr:four helix bundle protein [Bacteroidota bacterium]
MENRTPSKSFRDLIVWQKAHQLVLDIYKMTKSFPKEEIYGLTSQIRRSSTSVAANIAEGFRKRSAADKARIMNIGQGSLAETEYYLILAQDLLYSDTRELLNKEDKVGRILDAYINSMKK